MKVLFISASPINNSVSIGNTFLNIMPEKTELASVYTKNGFPDRRIKSAFRMNEKMIINRLFGKSKCVGEKVGERYGEEANSNLTEVDANVVQYAQKKRYTLMFWAQGLIWRLPFWKSKELEAFISDFDPDVIYTVLSNNIYFNRILLHILKISGKPLALYAWDNNYNWNKFQRSPLRWINQFFERSYMRKVVEKADKFYVISDIQKKDYEEIFHKECTVLTKGADFWEEPQLKREYGNPLQLVFTGNIGTNRWKSLALIASALKKINADGTKAELRIYTGTPLTAEMEKALNIDGSSYIMGSVSSSKIPKIQSDADILVHVEALDNVNRFLVKQSFSTKIVDYLKATRPILAVGPYDVASIDHLIKNDCAIIAETEKELIDKLDDVINNPDKLTETALRGYECGKKHHDKATLNKMIENDLKETQRKNNS